MMTSLYSGASGLKAYGEGMNVIGNNLSNTNTIGYKQISMQYSDLMSEFLSTSAANNTNISQKGMGVMPGSTRTLFKDGAVETGSSVTDLCISGKGFFGVTHDGEMHYTRAGNFRFNKQGELLDPSGWQVMGREIVDGEEAGQASPVKLNLGANGYSTVPPKATTLISTGSRLGGLENRSGDEENPFFSLASSWNGASSTPLSSGSYGYGEPISFYDSNGDLRKATIYYDLAGSTNGLTAVEYVMALDPGEDGSALVGTQAEGLLMAGTLTFSGNGELANFTAFYPPASGDPSDLSGWTPANLQNGQPTIAIQPSGAEAQTITLDMGIALNGANANSSAGLASAAEAAANPKAIYDNTVPKDLSANSTIFQGSQPANLYANRDGYAPGEMRDMVITDDGTVRILYNNNQTQDVFRLSLYRFTSEDGLKNEGSNHFSATKESGAADEGVAGEENFGSLKSYALEQSNVDYAREFSNMIVTQRGFQMNSKVVTTTDTMLQKALELKR